MLRIAVSSLHHPFHCWASLLLSFRHPIYGRNRRVLAGMSKSVKTGHSSLSALSARFSSFRDTFLDTFLTDSGLFQGGNGFYPEGF